MPYSSNTVQWQQCVCVSVAAIDYVHDPFYPCNQSWIPIGTRKYGVYTHRHHCTAFNRVLTSQYNFHYRWVTMFSTKWNINLSSPPQHSHVDYLSIKDKILFYTRDTFICHKQCHTQVFVPWWAPKKVPCSKPTGGNYSCPPVLALCLGNW